MKNLLRIAVLSILMTSCFGGSYIPTYYAPYGKAYTATIDDFVPTNKLRDSSEFTFCLNYHQVTSLYKWSEFDVNSSSGEGMFSVTRHLNAGYVSASLKYSQGTYEFNNRYLNYYRPASYSNLGFETHAGVTSIPLNNKLHLSMINGRLNLDYSFGQYSKIIEDYDQSSGSTNSDTLIIDESSYQRFTISAYTELQYDISNSVHCYLRLGYCERGFDYDSSELIRPIYAKKDVFATVAIDYRGIGIYCTFSHPTNRQEVTRPNLGFYWAF